MDGWDQVGFTARKRHFSLFIYFSIKLSSPQKSQTSETAPPWYTLGLALYPERHILGHQLLYLQTIECQSSRKTPNSHSSTLSCTNKGQSGSEKEMDLLKVMKWDNCGLKPRCPDSWMSTLPLHHIVTSSMADLQLGPLGLHLFQLLAGFWGSLCNPRPFR